MSRIEQLFVGFWNWVICNIDEANARTRRAMNAEKSARRISAPQAGTLNMAEKAGPLNMGRRASRTGASPARKTCIR